jgi:hypothetical protein
MSLNVTAIVAFPLSVCVCRQFLARFPAKWNHFAGSTPDKNVGKCLSPKSSTLAAFALSIAACHDLAVPASTREME